MGSLQSTSASLPFCSYSNFSALYQLLPRLQIADVVDDRVGVETVDDDDPVSCQTIDKQLRVAVRRHIRDLALASCVNDE